jgi:hypothetical protein
MVVQHARYRNPSLDAERLEGGQIVSSEKESSGRNGSSWRSLADLAHVPLSTWGDATAVAIVRRHALSWSIACTAVAGVTSGQRDGPILLHPVSAYDNRWRIWKNQSDAPASMEPSKRKECLVGLGQEIVLGGE